MHVAHAVDRLQTYVLANMNLFGVLSDTYMHRLSGVLADELSGVLADELSSVLADIYAPIIWCVGKHVCTNLFGNGGDPLNHL